MYNTNPIQTELFWCPSDWREGVETAPTSNFLQLKLLKRFLTIHSSYQACLISILPK